MRQLSYARTAQTDLLESWLAVAEKNLDSADQILDTIDHEASLLLDNPSMGRLRPELGDNIRSWVTKTPYILFYQVCDNDIVIVRVLHHARDISVIF